jgi:ureidoglycolate hydrolase
MKMSHVKTVENWSVEAFENNGRLVEIGDWIAFHYNGKQRVGKVERIGQTNSDKVVTLQLFEGGIRAFHVSKMVGMYLYG